MKNAVVNIHKIILIDRILSHFYINLLNIGLVPDEDD
jgi:hypothetical protein